jgi:hypothetical protein
LGSLAAGWLADHFGVRAALRLAGLSCAVFAVAYVIILARPMRDRVWEMYREKLATARDQEKTNDN